MPILKDGVRKKAIDFKLLLRLLFITLGTSLAVIVAFVALLAVFEKWGFLGVLAVILGLFAVLSLSIYGLILPRLRWRAEKTEAAKNVTAQNDVNERTTGGNT